MSVTMLDYVKAANSVLRKNLDCAEELTQSLVHAFQQSACSSIRIVACGSSRHSADCARHYMQAVLKVPVLVVTPETFVNFEHDFPAGAFNIAITQSGYSTNTLAALDFMHNAGMPYAALTGNTEAPVRQHADTVIDYGVGLESVDFVTQGVQTLVLYLMLFALYAGRARGVVDNATLSQKLGDLAGAIDAHAGALHAASAFTREQRLQVARMAPSMFVGTGPNFGVAEEGSLKFAETLKHPSMYFEGEEFIHGPEMQVTPGHTIFIVDDAPGSGRLRAVFKAMHSVTQSAYFITAHPRGDDGELALPEVPDPLTCAIPNLVPFQYLAAAISEELNCWDVHPYLDAVSDQIEAKAAGYDDAVKHLKELAVQTQKDTAES